MLPIGVLRTQLVWVACKVQEAGNLSTSKNQLVGKQRLCVLLVGHSSVIGMWAQPCAQGSTAPTSLSVVCPLQATQHDVEADLRLQAQQEHVSGQTLFGCQVNVKGTAHMLQ